MNQKHLILLLLLCSGFPLLHGQISYPSPSPETKLSQLVGHTHVSLRYERPAARGREIFGGLVPWNQVWRTGAGMATLIRFSQAVSVGNQAVPAGSYALYTIPNPDSWTVILNADTSLYGAYGYTSDKDVARFDVPVSRTERYVEGLSIGFDFIPNKLECYISWVHTQIHFPIEPHTDAIIMAQIEEQVAKGASVSVEQYLDAANFLLFQRKNLHQALHFANQARGLNPDNYFAVRTQVSINKHLGYYEKALRLIEEGIVVSEKRDLPTAEDRANDLRIWEAERNEIQARMHRP